MKVSKQHYEGLARGDHARLSGLPHPLCLQDQLFSSTRTELKHLKMKTAGIHRNIAWVGTEKRQGGSNSEAEKMRNFTNLTSDTTSQRQLQNVCRGEPPHDHGSTRGPLPPCRNPPFI